MRRFQLVLLLALTGCPGQPKIDTITLSYSQTSTSCWGCPRFSADFRSGGHVDYECLSDCAVPGEQHYLVPAQRFQELVHAFRDAGFFAIPRTDPSRIVFDAPIIRLTYRDERRIHEVVGLARQIPRITELETRMKAATEVDRYLKPSVTLARSRTGLGTP